MNVARLSAWAKAAVREARRQRVSRIVADSPGDARALRALLRGSGAPGPATIGIRALDGRRVALRARTTDAEVAVATFAGRYHLPPPLAGPVESIWDVGANIGLTTAHLAQLHPHAQVVALEPHPANFACAQANTAEYAQRCVLLQRAAWTYDGTVGLEGESGPEDGYRVSETRADGEVEAISFNTLLDRFGAPDYLKLDVEGGERALLNESTQWAASVRCISVECHPPYSLSECVSDLERLGFSTQALPQTLRRRARDCAIGVRRRGAH
ncbi:MAG TPA: FkbM family methyltransferase [Solirubrobacteraceae bacterium]|nr:FkbM family methyltransferase [Solirubrobacteraceae bacterium]